MTRQRSEWTKTRQRVETDLSELSAAYAEAEWHYRDDLFCRALTAAIELGLEHPPMMGADTRPCTKKPVFVPHRHNPCVSLPD